MTESHSLLQANDTERQELLIQLQNLGITTDDEVARMRSKSPEELQKFIDGLLNTKQELQDYCMQLITIKDVIEQYLSRLISDMLNGTDVGESLRHGMQIYPSLQFIRWMVGEGEKNLAEFVKELDLDSHYVLPILYRWKYEYKPLNDVWWELQKREQGRENNWTSMIVERYYNELRHVPQISITLMSRTKIVWKAREDIDDISRIAEMLLRTSLLAFSEPPEHIEPSVLENMRDTIREVEKIIEDLKAVRVLNYQKVSDEN